VAFNAINKQSKEEGEGVRFRGYDFGVATLPYMAMLLTLAAMIQLQRKL